MRTFPKTPDDVVLMDWKISFTPTDLSDITPREQKFQTNPKVSRYVFSSFNLKLT